MFLSMPQAQQGVNLSRYLVVPRVLIFITRRNEVLLLKGASGKRLWKNKYNGVGGHVERGEDPLSAAHRELFEETGLRTHLSLCGTVIVDTGKNIGVGLYIFSGECAAQEARASQEGMLEWVPFDKIPEKPIVEDLEILFKMVRQVKKGSDPFVARSYYGKNGKLTVTIPE